MFPWRLARSRLDLLDEANTSKDVFGDSAYRSAAAEDPAPSSYSLPIWACATSPIRWSANRPRPKMQRFVDAHGAEVIRAMTNARKGDMIEVRTHPVRQRTFPPVKFIIGPDGRLHAASVANAKVIEAWEAAAK